MKKRNVNMTRRIIRNIRISAKNFPLDLVASDLMSVRIGSHTPKTFLEAKVLLARLLGQF